MKARSAKNVLLIVLGYLAQQQLASSKCPVFKALVVPNWARVQLAGVEWFEVLNYPGPLSKCAVRKYHPSNETMDWIEKDEAFGEVKRRKRYDFIMESRQQFLNKDRSFFQQILDSDLATWALLHICSEGDRKSKFTLTLREPLSVIPGDIETRVYQTLQRAGVNQGIKWTKSPCMLDRTINAIFPQPPATLYPPPDAVLPYDAEGVPELALKTEMPPDAGSPLETQAAQEDDMPEETELPQEAGMPEEIGVPQYVTPPPETDMVPGASMAPDTNMPKDIETSQEVSVPPETETATELILVPLTTPWLPYENDEESW
ncbi:uncharacterized protein LOC144118518 [Amblyomma americanum]